MLQLLPLVLSVLGWAAPPSSHLTGDAGALTWTISEAGDVVTVAGSSPKWTVQHTAGTDLRPRATTRTNPDGAVTTVAWADGKVTVTLPGGKLVSHDDPDIWDGDTLDVRLGDRVKRGVDPAVTFSAVDSGSGKVYRFDAVDKGQETCATGPCRHVNVTLAGWMKMLGPSFDYWFASDGRLVKFEGPAGNFAAK